MGKYILETANITKQYGGVVALSNVSMQFETGMIHALVGENGAGKSTLIRILSGIEMPTNGEVIFRGEKVTTFEPYKAHELGISTVYQEPMQVSQMSVRENLFLGRYNKNRLGLVDYKDLENRANKLMKKMGIWIDTKASIASLSVAKQQMVEILKAVSFDSKLIIFDEPTASLTLEETENLKEIILGLKASGVTIIYISHRLEEIFDLCDTVSVLRDGKFIGKKNISEINTDQLINMMVGRKMENIYPQKSNNFISKDVLLKVDHITNEHVKDISFELHRGEILGFSGLVGAGRTEVANVIFGIDSAEGKIYLNGQEIHIRNPADAIEHRIAMVPENRKQQGLVQILSVGDNTILGCLKQIKNGILINHNKEKSIINDYINRLRIKTPSKNQLVRNLSGGNQQKVVFAKWMATKPEVLILDEPTQGVDVGAKTEIYNIINDIVAMGTGVIMISSEMNELIAMSDRICIMREGYMNGILERKEFAEDVIMKYAIEEVCHENK